MTTCRIYIIVVRFTAVGQWRAQKCSKGGDDGKHVKNNHSYYLNESNILPVLDPHGTNRGTTLKNHE